MLKILAKLLEVQKRMKPVLKEGKNPHFKNTFYDINALLGVLKPILNDLGVVALQPFTMWNGQPALQTRLIDVESSEEVQSIITLPETTDAPKMGAAITYYRRYALTSILCIEGEDDDGEVPKLKAKLTPFEAARQAIKDCEPDAEFSLREKIANSPALDNDEKMMLSTLFA